MENIMEREKESEHQKRFLSLDKGFPQWKALWTGADVDAEISVEVHVQG